MKVLKEILRWLAMPMIRCCGSRVCDEDSGEELGRAWIVVWRGRIHLLGFTGGVPVVPVFLPEERVRYWRRRIGFRVVPVPDYPRLPVDGRHAERGHGSGVENGCRH